MASNEAARSMDSAVADATATQGERWLTFLSDYGLDDHFVGVCKGVIVSIVPQVKIIDICHQVDAQNIEVGARLLAEAEPYLPVGVHLALVDPFRAEQARAVAIRVGSGSILVCPDNGIASLAWPVMGGVEEVRLLSNEQLWGEHHPTSTFRGRDVFAPVAAHLAAGTPFAEVGERIEAGSLIALAPRHPYVHGDHVHGTVRMIDHFGNLQLNLARADLEAVGVTLGDSLELRFSGKSMKVSYVLNLSDVPSGRTCVYEDSFSAITVMTKMGRAERVLRAEHGDPIVLARVAKAAATPEGKVRVIDSRPSTATA